MHAEIISVGTELTTGASLDTNSQWLSLELAAIGISVSFHTTVADDLAATGRRDSHCGRPLRHRHPDGRPRTDARRPHAPGTGRRAGGRAGARSGFAGIHPRALSTIQAGDARAQRRSRPISPAAPSRFPICGERLPASGPTSLAPTGTACFFAALPGVPSEMKRMFAKEVVPRLPAGNRVIRRARLNCFGVGESQAEEMLGDLTARGRDPEIGITVHEATITLRIVAHGDTAEACDSKIAAAKARHSRADGRPQSSARKTKNCSTSSRGSLDKRGSTIATVEIGTGGLLARRITEVPDYERAVSGRNRRCLAGSAGPHGRLVSRCRQANDDCGGTRTLPRAIGGRVCHLRRRAFRTSIRTMRPKPPPRPKSRWLARTCRGWSITRFWAMRPSTAAARARLR